VTATGALPATTLAAVYYGKQDIRFESVATPRAGPGEVLLRVTAVGVCGTDAAEWAYGATQYPVGAPHPVTGHVGPLVIGHEFAGEVVEVGSGVDAGWLGRLVASCGAVPCGRCPPCAAGRTNQCRQYSAVGLHRHGALAGYVSVPLASCLDAATFGLGPDEAALAQPMSIAVHVGRRGGVGAGDTAVVLGVGGIGAFLVHVLVQWGVRVLAVDMQEQRLTIAEQLGAALTLRAGSDDDVKRIHERIGEYPDVLFEVTGTAAGLRTGLAALPTGGRLVLVGVQKQPVELTLHPVTLREQQIIGTNAMIRETDLAEAMRLLSIRRGGWAVLAPRVIPLRALVDDALRPMSEGRPPAVKTLVDPFADGPRDLR
jgi:(R,R)-butanediol dehydrogenase / meso-butanediol dehydrogenase / diacetyl reductase